METIETLKVKQEWNAIQQKDYENKVVKIKEEFDKKVSENSNIETDESAILKHRAYFYGQISSIFKARLYDIKLFVEHLEMPNDIGKKGNKFSDKADLAVRNLFDELEQQKNIFKGNNNIGFNSLFKEIEELKIITQNSLFQLEYS